MLTSNDASFANIADTSGISVSCYSPAETNLRCSFDAITLADKGTAIHFLRIVISGQRCSVVVSSLRGRTFDWINVVRARNGQVVLVRWTPGYVVVGQQDPRGRDELSRT
jgi:hypothetical protein